VRKTVPVAELQFGMYVAELDRPWTETPFKFQGFVLQRPEQLEMLKKYCKTVFVDPDREEILDRLPDQAPLGAIRSAVDLSRTGRTKYAELAPVEQEYSAASATHAAGAATVRDALGALRAGRTLEAKRVDEAVNGVTESVMRNADAMLLFTRLQQKGDYTQSHALDVSVYMTAFGRFMEMSPEDIRLLGHVGLLQDVGKMRLPDALIQKRERLTQEEFALAKKHVEHSAEILRATPGLPGELPDLALLHHERHDGSGYPKGLRGKEIGLIGSIAGSSTLSTR
jgi:HD-GYP domain-containing protein (c-di-GMP phosphodiesterase class II)